MLRAERPEKERTVNSRPAETQVRAVKQAGISKSESQAERASQIEINNFVAWERQHAEERQVDLPQADLIKPIQRQAVLKSPDAARATTVDKSVVPESLTQLTDIANRLEEPLDVISQMTPEPVLIEAEQEHVEAATIDGLEAPTLPEDFDIKGVDFESTDEPLSVDDIYLETGMIEEDEGSVDALLADLEEGMQQVEAEYMGELLVSMFASITETEIIEGVEDVADVHLPQGIPLETEEDVSTTSETPTLQGVEKEFSLYLESLEPTQVEATKNVIEELGVAIKESQQLPEEVTAEEKEIIEHKLEELCVELFEGLGLEYDEETIKQFIQSLITQESFINLSIETDELSIEVLNNMGTREYKAPEGISLLGGLTQFIKHKMQPHLILGRYALQVCSA